MSPDLYRPTHKISSGQDEVIISVITVARATIRFTRVEHEISTAHMIFISKSDMPNTEHDLL